jgi:hypothetical protein
LRGSAVTSGNTLATAGNKLLERIPMNNLNRALAATMIAAAIGGSTFSCATDPLNIKCSEYITSAESEQLELAAQWAAKPRDQVTEIERIAAQGYRKDFLAYCPNHPDDRLNQLEISFGFH